MGAGLVLVASLHCAVSAPSSMSPSVNRLSASSSRSSPTPKSFAQQREERPSAPFQRFLSQRHEAATGPAALPPVSWPSRAFREGEGCVETVGRNSLLAPRGFRRGEGPASRGSAFRGGRGSDQLSRQSTRRGERGGSCLRSGGSLGSRSSEESADDSCHEGSFSATHSVASQSSARDSLERNDKAAQQSPISGGDAAEGAPWERPGRLSLTNPLPQPSPDAAEEALLEDGLEKAPENGEHRAGPNKTPLRWIIEPPPAHLLPLLTREAFRCCCNSCCSVAPQQRSLRPLREGLTRQQPLPQAVSSPVLFAAVAEGAASSEASSLPLAAPDAGGADKSASVNGERRSLFLEPPPKAPLPSSVGGERETPPAAAAAAEVDATPARASGAGPSASLALSFQSEREKSLAESPALWSTRTETGGGGPCFEWKSKNACSRALPNWTRPSPLWQGYVVIKKLNFILRHGAPLFRLPIREDGFVRVRELLALHCMQHVTWSDIQTVSFPKSNCLLRLAQEPAELTLQRAV